MEESLEERTISDVEWDINSRCRIFPDVTSHVGICVLERLNAGCWVEVEGVAQALGFAPREEIVGIREKVTIPRVTAPPESLTGLIFLALARLFVKRHVPVHVFRRRE